MLPDWLEFCEFELFCEFMSELEEDWLWVDDDGFELLCAAAASVNTRNANNRSNVTLFMTFSLVSARPEPVW